MRLLDFFSKLWNRVLIVLLFFSSISFADENIANFKEKLVKRGVKFFDKVKKQNPSKFGKLVVDLKNPIFKNGILITKDGGVIYNDDIRIQARTIQYVRRIEGRLFVHRLEAEGDLMVVYKGRVYIGDELNFNFITGSGIVYKGKTFIDPWFVGGDRIELKNDGSYEVTNVSITTCTNKDSSWDIHANSVRVEKTNLLSANKVCFRFFKIPTLWLPSFKVNLKKYFTAPLMRYRVSWDKGAGPKLSARYRIYSWEDFMVFLKLDWRLKRGFGGAVETEYFPKSKKTSFVTRNYLATDTLPNDPKNKRRYRVQGAYHTTSPSKTTTADLSWDKFSDVHMPGDFKSDDFEINTAKRTELLVRHEEGPFIAILHARPRVNPFETLKQDIPTFYILTKPLQIDKINLISQNYIKASYLKMSFSDKLRPYLEDFHSGRLEVFQGFYRPFSLGIIKLVPEIGFRGILYTSYEDKGSRALGSLNYGLRLSTEAYKRLVFHCHTIEPYIHFFGETKPTLKNHYVFSIQDGFHSLNILKVGVKNDLFSTRHLKADPSFSVDLYSNLFLEKDARIRTLPKLYLDLIWNLPSLTFGVKNCWNFEREVLDFSNCRFGWTVNRDLAFKLEFRHRSKYDWRKADHESFILDTARKDSELLLSPLSDKRETFLTGLFVRISPYWSCQFESHHGWDRINEPHYNEFRLDFFTLLSINWKLRISYTQTQTGGHFSLGVSSAER